jgi:hypothetical protein
MIQLNSLINSMGQQGSLLMMRKSVGGTKGEIVLQILEGFSTTSNAPRHDDLYRAFTFLLQKNGP